MEEPKTIGLTPSTKVKLERLKTEGYFKEMQDAYKYAVGLALACGGISDPLRNSVTIYGTGDIDQDRALYDTVKILRSDMNIVSEPVYKTIERLAEWGVNELSGMADAGSIDFMSIIESLKKAKAEK